MEAFAQGDVHEAFGPAIGPRSIGSRSGVAGADAAECGLEGTLVRIREGAVAPDPLDTHTVAAQPGGGAAEEGGATPDGLFGHNFRARKVRTVVKGELQVLPARAPSPAAVIADGAVA